MDLAPSCRPMAHRLQIRLLTWDVKDTLLRLRHPPSSSFKVILGSSTWNSLLQTLLWITSQFLWESDQMSQPQKVLLLCVFINDIFPSPSCTPHLTAAFFFYSTYHFMIYLFIVCLSVLIRKGALSLLFLGISKSLEQELKWSKYKENYLLDE